jgi:hypothetical protein
MNRQLTIAALAALGILFVLASEVLMYLQVTVNNLVYTLSHPRERPS